MALLVVEGISKSFETPAGRRDVLKDVSLSVEAGEFVSIVGAMGSLGLDGFVTEHLSIGAELGVLGSFAFGSDEEGDSKNDAVIVSATTGLFVTVWL